MDHAQVMKCDICDRFFMEILSDGQTGTSTCHLCELNPDPLDRFASEFLINKVLETGDIFALSDHEEFELHYSHVFEYHPSLKKHPLLLDLALYLWEKFEL